MLVIWLQIFRVKKWQKKKHHALLEECRYEQEKTNMENLIDDDLEKDLSDESDNDI